MRTHDSPASPPENALLTWKAVSERPPSSGWLTCANGVYHPRRSPQTSRKHRAMFTKCGPTRYHYPTFDASRVCGDGSHDDRDGGERGQTATLRIIKRELFNY
ncbi:hypothetical protein TcasGA2_TC009043 [Tribolium castaneum]|uniref:Uncharacterized protein n=1 Tax=Tribolium castaneum TaxID=7070 RepID=D6WPP1_TRICA|nr:hypothetical protein TcasGA2_TC009043 [Tribolium castaneum]